MRSQRGLPHSRVMMRKTVHDLADVEDIYPLTPLQQGMLFHSLADPASGVYVEQFWCSLQGTLDTAAFRAAWERVIARHAVLRTSFVLTGVQEPAQVVHRTATVPLTVVDWESRGEEEQARFFATVLRNDAARGFDSGVAPLMRLQLYRCSPVHHRFLWSFHHALLDGWSVPLVLGELFACYAAFVHAREPSLPLVPPYRDYVTWLRRQDIHAAETFWRAHLGGVTDGPGLAFRKTRQVTGSGCAGSRGQERWLDPATTAALIASAKLHHLTPATLLHAAWALILMHYGGSTDVVFGSTIAGRPHTLPHADSMVGLFINTVPVRVAIDRNMPCHAWLQHVQAVLATVREFGFCGLEDIRRWSGAPGDSRLFESIVVYENYPVMPLSGDAAGVNPGDLVIGEMRSEESTNLPLTVVGGCGERFMIRILRDPAVFEEGAVDLLLTELVRLLTAFSEPEGTVGSFLDPGDGVVATSVVRGETVVRTDGSVLDLIARHARDVPDAPAVECALSSITYGELDRRSDRLAGWLLSRGLRQEENVGILVGPTPERIIALLAVMKAGAACVPLDQRYPAERLRYIIGDSRTAWVLTDRREASDVLPPGTTVIGLHDLNGHAGAPPSPVPATRVPGLLRAYTIYTSGSTGRPKGIEVHHAALLNLALAYGERFGLDRTTRYLQFYAFGFDGSMGDIFGTLVAGGTLIVPDQQVLGSIPDLQDLLIAQRVNTIMMTPTILSVMEGMGPGLIRTVIAGGEVCQSSLAARWAGDCAFHNAYGPTETTVAATTFRAGNDHLLQGPLPIGTPLPNVHAYVLDEALRPVPQGVPGELYVGGVGVARGYCGRPDLTAAVFLPDPFTGEAGGRMYRTGDRVRLLPDGNLTFIERVDLQIKVRGYRIEPGEIEAVIRSDPAVGDVIVLCRKTGTGGEHLVAYVTRGDGAGIDPEDLRQVCARKLPSYMVPSHVVVMDAFPVTANGKVDRSALPEPRDVAEQQHGYMGARTPTEQGLVAIWERVLQRHPVGIHDDFFTLGGHSLRALQLLGEVEKQFGHSFPLLTFFQHPTVEVLAALIDSAAPVAAGSPLVTLRHGQGAPPLFLVHPTGGSVHWYVDLVHALPRERPVYGLQAAGLEGDDEPDLTIEAMVTRYCAAIHEMHASGQVHIAGWSLGVIIGYALAVRLVQRGYDVLSLGVIDQGPEPPVRRDPADSAELLEDIFGESLGVDAGFLRTMPDEDRYLYVLRLARKKGLVPVTVRRKQFMRYLRLNQTEGHAWRAYEVEPYPGRIALFCADDDGQGAVYEEGWRALAAGGVESIRVPGDHLSMMRPPHVQVLASRLDDTMAVADEQWKRAACHVIPTF